ncbi:hypothetical protein [Streptomyces sp. NPDC054783]
MRRIAESGRRVAAGLAGDDDLHPGYVPRAAARTLPATATVVG